MNDFQFPAMPGPKEQGLNRKGEHPLPGALEGIDQVETRAAAGLVTTLPAFSAHHDEEQGGIRCSLAQVRPRDPIG